MSKEPICISSEDERRMYQRRAADRALADKQELLRLVTEYSNAAFDCGAWRDEDQHDEDDERYGDIYARWVDARTALCSALELPSDEAVEMVGKDRVIVVKKVEGE